MCSVIVRLGCFVPLCLVVVAARAADLDRDKLRKQIIRHEGLRNKVYKDSEGIPTIGVGFNLTRPDARAKIQGLGLNYDKVLAGQQELSETQALKLLEGDIDGAVADCRAVFPNFTQLSDVRQRALVDMMFNLGKTRLLKFEKMIAAVKAEQFAKAADEMKGSQWYAQVKTRGKELESMMRNDHDP
jgi:lysozyme